MEEIDYTSHQDIYNAARLLQGRLKTSKSYFENLAAFKEYYLSIETKIKDFTRERRSQLILSYPTDIEKCMTKIEWMAWEAMRYKGGLPFYPQYPVGKYYLDFGNPYFKIGIELDGYGFHDAKKDLERDKHLKELGWTIYRISGSEIYNTSKEYLAFEVTEEQMDEMDEEAKQIVTDWILNSGDGVLESIKNIHIEQRTFEDSYWGEFLYSLQLMTLKKHKLV